MGYIGITFKTSIRFELKELLYILGYLILAIFALISCIHSPIFFSSLGKVKTMFIICLNLLVILVFIKTHRIRIYDLKFALFIGLTMNIILYFQNNPIYFDSWRFQGTRDNPNYLAVLSCFSVFVSLIDNSRSNGSKLINSCIVFMSLFLVVVAASKKGVFIWAILIFFWLVRSKINILLLFSTFMIGIILVRVTNFSEFDQIHLLQGRLNEFIQGKGTSTNERRMFIVDGLNVFYNNLFFGSGVDTLRIRLGTYSHSNFIELASGLGLTGLLAYGFLYVGIVLKAFASRKMVFYMAWVLSLLVLEVSQVSYYYKWTILSNFLIIGLDES